MTPTTAFLTALVICVLLQAYECSLNITKSPGEAHAMLTKELSVACRLPIDNSATGLTAIHSMLIRRGSNVVAAITAANPTTPMVLLDMSSLNVTGEITTSPVGAFLNLTWNYPTETQTGQYKCQLTGMTRIGLPISYTSLIEVEVKTPEIRDLVRYIHANQNELEKKQKEIEKNRKENERQSHIESGVVHCIDSIGWRGDRDSDSDTNIGDKHVSFTQPYNKVPKVFIIIRDYESHHSGAAELGLEIRAKYVTKDGFNCYCYINGGRMWSLSYTWFSLPSP